MKFSDRDKIVKQFRKMYEENAPDVFSVIWNTKEFRKKLFGNSVTKENARLDFIDLVKDPKSEIFKFIRAE
ncbi:hypothetical protein [Myroides sp. WP-1]|uniref:hypothetical protein n=1 Tax=Myroides sp. WP-1 TaxID=2759944 RepID=UPI0015FB36BE|nr:hypothetical protein [Myroides sp. WP-1]MBB1140667.1 hypothetical protein [Myroides sp. WP-1]